MLTRSELVAAFCGMGLNAGDVVLVHSSLRALGPVEGGADTVIDALLEVLGPNGTLVLPTHTWKVVNASQPVFHVSLTPSNVGVLSNVFRHRPDVVRSLHPTHSVAAIGPRAEELIEGHERDDTPCAPTSPYGRLRDWGGKILIIGVGLECCTFFHGCEQWAGLPRAVSQDTCDLYSIAPDGRVIPVPSRRHIVNTWDQYPSLEPMLLAAGVLKICHVGTCPLRLLDARATAEKVIAQIREDPSIIFPAERPPESARDGSRCRSPNTAESVR